MYISTIRNANATGVISTYAFKTKVHIIHTAPNYMTTIILPYPISEKDIFIGNNHLFQAHIATPTTLIIKPITYAYGVSTDLVILDNKLRFVYRVISGKPKNANFLIYVKNPWNSVAVNNQFKNSLNIYKKQIQSAYAVKEQKLVKDTLLLQKDKTFIIKEFLKLNKYPENITQNHKNLTLTIKYISRAGGYDYIAYKLINDSPYIYNVANVTIGINNIPYGIYKDGLLKPILQNTITNGFIIFKAKTKDKNINLLVTAATSNQKVLQYKFNF
jgi:hypothetical protein